MNPSRHEDTSHIQVGTKQYSSFDLISFTSEFLESNKIGSGAYAEVYKGRFSDDIFRAVKVLKKMDFVENTFMAEVRTMGNVVHHNLVKLYGYCFEDNMKALVFEYLENGSLDKILYENNHGGIEWVKLYAIVIDIANGLKYLHHDLEEPIIHHDIKAANVLIDKKISAKIADFGLARIMSKDVSRVDLTRTRGTPGYSAPEAWMPGSQVTCKCDVFSFGMMLFEVLGKRKNGVEENWLPGIVWKQFENGNLEHFIKYCGIAKKDTENANILCKVALWCVQDNPDLRPSMKDVVLMLEKEKLVKDPPCPSFNFCQAFTPLVDLEESRRENIEREWSNKIKLDLNYPQNITAIPTYDSVAGSDGGIALQQLKSNKRKTRSTNMLEEDLATIVLTKGMQLPTKKLVGKTTALKYKDTIMQWIAKDEALTIGFHGMGGVGKTTIFKHVHNQLLVEGNCFDKIIWVTVSKDGNITKLQNDLAKELDLNLSCEDDILRRSRLLFEALEKRKRVVFFFDNVWTQISLDEIGIPEPTKKNGFKLILTTRLLDVCRRMGCHKDNTITIKCLPEDEAWELFMNKIDCVLTPDVEKIAKMVAKKCSGLPLAIITVGGAMRRNSDINEWRVALNDLNYPSNRIMDMEDNVYECLKFSYDRLENEKQRKCFLCCALYPEDWLILTRDLVDFWIMDGIVEGRNRQDELVECQYILNKLKDHCLLESINPFLDEYYKMSDGVKMHDLVREMALRLTNKSFLVKGPCLRELPNEEEWEMVLEKASFMQSMIEVVAISPICPNLSTLILGGSRCLMCVTHNFFVHMKCLKVLDLRCDPVFNFYGLKILPDSISDLVNLRALRLGWCKRLKKLPSLAKLVLLRKLELNDSGIEKLPEGMEMLVNLKCLNLHMVQIKKRIPIGLISKFCLLQELYLGGIEVDKLYNDGRGKTFVEELLSLKELENLGVGFHCLSHFASYVGSSKFNGLKCFFITIGEGFAYEHYIGPSPWATVQLSYPPDEQTALFFPKNTKRVEITSFHDVTRLNELEWLKNLRELVAFAIRDCNKIECIWSSKDENQEFAVTGTSWIQRLETIKIFGCTKIYTIFERIPIPFGALPVFCLKKLIITSCHNLKNVFPSSTLLQLLPNLEEIRIRSCYELEELIGDEEEETETPIAIPRLKYLLISGLPKLKRIWSGVIICDSLEWVYVFDCFELKRLPQLMGEKKSAPPPALNKIYGSNDWWDSLEWESVYPKDILQPFFIDDSPIYELEEDFWLDVDYTLLLEREKSFHSDECAQEGAGILDREKTFQLDLNVPVGYVCHNCEMYAILGMRYRCKDCWEKCIVIIPERGIGFDLCMACYNTPSKHSDLVNHHHTQGHTFELIANNGDGSIPVNLPPW